MICMSYTEVTSHTYLFETRSLLCFTGSCFLINKLPQLEGLNAHFLILGSLTSLRPNKVTKDNFSMCYLKRSNKNEDVAK